MSDFGKFIDDLQAPASQAWQAAIDEGLRVYWAYLHVGGVPAPFLGTSWEDGGYKVNGNGEPICDANNNTVAKFAVNDLDETSAGDWDLVREWYG